MEKKTEVIVVKYAIGDRSEIKTWIRANVLDPATPESIQEFLMEIHEKIRENQNR